MKDKLQKPLEICAAILTVTALLLAGLILVTEPDQPSLSLEGDPVTLDETEKEGIGKININTASAQELEMLPGVGPAIAGRIVAYRADKQFTSIKDLQNVKGIGPATYQKLEKYLTV